MSYPRREVVSSSMGDLSLAQPAFVRCLIAPDNLNFPDVVPGSAVVGLPLPVVDSPHDLLGFLLASVPASSLSPGFSLPGVFRKSLRPVESLFLPGAGSRACSRRVASSLFRSSAVDSYPLTFVPQKSIFAGSTPKIFGQQKSIFAGCPPTYDFWFLVFFHYRLVH